MAAAQRWVNTGGRFSVKAVMPSFWSALAKTAWKRRRSKRIPSVRVVSNARFTASFAIIATGADKAATVSATVSASVRW